MLKIKLEKGVTNIKGKHNSKEVTNIRSKQKKSDPRKREQALLTLKNPIFRKPNVSIVLVFHLYALALLNVYSTKLRSFPPTFVCPCLSLLCDPLLS